MTFLCCVPKLSTAHVILVPTDAHFRSCQHSIPNVSSNTDKGIYVFIVTLQGKFYFLKQQIKI